MNSRVLLLLLIVSGLSLAAIAARNGGLLILAVPFLTYMLVGLMKLPVKIALAASRSTDRSSVLAGEPVQVSLRLTNAGDALANVRVVDTLPAEAHLPGAPARQVFCLQPHESVDMHYVFTGARMICAWRTVGVSAADPLGLFEVSMQIPAPGEVIIRPKPLGITEFAFRPIRTLHTTGPVPVPLPGSGTDFLGVREYRLGDPLRKINWRLTARHSGRLFTNEQERHEVADYGLILDTRLADSHVLEQAIRATASLAERVLGDGNRLSLLIFGMSMAATYPGYGKRQLSLVLRSLAAATQSPFFPLDYLEYFPARLFGNRAVLLMISSGHPSDRSTYARLRSAGFSIVLVSPDPLVLGGQSGNGRLSRQSAIRAARIERRAELLALSKMGVHIVDWQVDQPIQLALQSLSPRGTHRRTPTS